MTVTDPQDVVSRHDYGPSRFTATFAACDASVARYDDQLLVVAGAAVTDASEWYAWWSLVTYEGDDRWGLASYWAEYVTLVHAVNRIQRGVVLCDLLGAVAMVSRQLLNVPLHPGREHTFQRIVAQYGQTPRVVPSPTKVVKHVGRADDRLQHRAHLIAGHVRRARDGLVDTQFGVLELVPYCAAIAQGDVDR